MCGISGIIDLKGEQADRTILETMTKLVEHRGPDGGALWSGRNVGLGHRLLSITGNHLPTEQPLQDKSGQYIIAFNGQVYNYKQLKNNLEKKGHQFETASDTEVVLKSYIEYGESCNELFNGMWAFAIVDLVHGCLFLSRDRFGQKPLYYTRQRHQFFFFSELKQLKAIPFFAFQLNRQKAADFLIHGLLNTDEQTLVEDVFSIKPGHSVRLDLNSGAMQESCWYRPQFHEPVQMDFHEAAQHLSELLYDSLALRVPEQVPAGAFLSGGLDSSSLLSMVHRNGLKNHLGAVVSCIIPFEGYNEEKYINDFNTAYQLNSVRFQPDFKESMGDDLNKCLYHQDQPITGISHLAEWLLFAQAYKSGARVMLDGQGADEVLGGYPVFYYKKLIQSFTNYSFMNAAGSLLRKMSQQKSSVLSEVKNLLLYHPLSYRLPLLQRSKNQVKSWLSFDYSSLPSNDKKSTDNNEHHLISRLSVSQITNDLPYLLHSVDRNSMAFGIETRLPYLDHRLVDFLLNTPDQFKLKGLTTKRLLREAMRGQLPADILDRKKMGFSTPDELLVKNIPVEAWKFDELFDRFPGMFLTKAKSELGEYIHGKRRYNYGFFRLLTFSRWASIFGVQLSAIGVFNKFVPELMATGNSFI